MKLFEIVCDGGERITFDAETIYAISKGREGLAECTVYIRGDDSWTMRCAYATVVALWTAAVHDIL